MRTKSFAELHTLWSVLVKERNVLATQREERRRLGLQNSEGGDLITKRTFRVSTPFSLPHQLSLMVVPKING
jgi:large subunit ribosomal protein L47